MISNIYEYVAYIVNTLIGYDMPPINALTAFIGNLAIGEGNWVKLLSPDIIIPFITLMTCFYIVLSLCLIFPYRFLKWIINAPDKKGRGERSKK